MYRSDYLIKIGQLRTRLATIVSGSDIMKKNQINRDLDEDTGGNDFEQKLLDHLTKITNKSRGGDNARYVADKFKNRKTNKKTGEVSFTL